MAHKPRMIQNFHSLPLYGNRRAWTEALSCSYATLQAGRWAGKLRGCKIGQDWYYTRQQILSWYAPSLYKEIYGKDPDEVEGDV